MAMKKQTMQLMKLSKKFVLCNYIFHTTQVKLGWWWVYGAKTKTSSCSAGAGACKSLSISMMERLVIKEEEDRELPRNMEMSTLLPPYFQKYLEIFLLGLEGVHLFALFYLLTPVLTNQSTKTGSIQTLLSMIFIIFFHCFTFLFDVFDSCFHATK